MGPFPPPPPLLFYLCWLTLYFATRGGFHISIPVGMQHVLGTCKHLQTCSHWGECKQKDETFFWSIFLLSLDRQGGLKRVIYRLREEGGGEAYLCASILLSPLLRRKYWDPLVGPSTRQRRRRRKWWRRRKSPSGLIVFFSRLEEHLLVWHFPQDSRNRRFSSDLLLLLLFSTYWMVQTTSSWATRPTLVSSEVSPRCLGG